MKVKLINQKRLMDGFFKIDKVKLQFEKIDGSFSKPVKRFHIDRGQAAAAVIFLRDVQELVFVKQFRYAHYSAGKGGWTTEIVAGLLDGDSPMECIKRECREETGYELEKVEKICTFFATPGITNEKVHLFAGVTSSVLKKYKGGGLEEEEEDIQVIRFPVAEVKERLKNHYFDDGKTIIALQHFFLFWERENGEMMRNEFSVDYPRI
jgi:ADP-ribose pyrophosphatase